MPLHVKGTARRGATPTSGPCNFHSWEYGACEKKERKKRKGKKRGKKERNGGKTSNNNGVSFIAVA